MSKVLDDTFSKLLDAYPDSYDAGNMRELWTQTWEKEPLSVIVRTADRLMKTWQRCPSLDEFMEETKKETHRQNRAALLEQMDACPECDHGYIETKENTFKPCHSCLPDSYERWAVGDYEPTRT